MRSSAPQALCFNTSSDDWEMIRKIMCWVFAVFVILLMNAQPIAAAGSASQYCKEEKPVALGPGNWDGTFEQVITATFGKGDTSGNYTWTVNGTLKVHIDDNGILSTVDGEMKGTGSSNIRGQWGSGKGAHEFGGRLEKFGPQHPTPTAFNTRVQVNYSLQASASGGNQVARNGKGDIEINFWVTDVTCDTASGKFELKNFDRGAMLAEKGFTIKYGPAKWEAQNPEANNEEIQKLKQELQQSAPPGIVRTRDAERKRFMDIMSRIQQKNPSIRPCLERVWSNFVRNKLAEWVAADAPRIAKWPGDAVTFLEVGERMLSAVKQAALLGVDTCTVDPQQRAFDAFSSGGSKLLVRMVQGGLPPADIISLLRKLELVGSISPPARDKTYDYLSSQAKRQYEDAEAKYKQALAAHGENHDDPVVVGAFGKVKQAGKVFKLNGGNPDSDGTGN